MYFSGRTYPGHRASCDDDLTSGVEMGRIWRIKRKICLLYLWRWILEPLAMAMGQADIPGRYRAIQQVVPMFGMQIYYEDSKYYVLST